MKKSSQKFGKNGKRKDRGVVRNNVRNDEFSNSRAVPAGTHDKMSAMNDFGWYNSIPQLLNSAASIPYANVPGQNIDLGTRYQINVGIGSNPLTVQENVGNTIRYPGLLSMDWLPSVGYSDSNTSPVSLAAKEIYSKIRAAYSGTIPEDAPDLIMYMMAMDSVFSYLSYLKKLYRALGSYSPFNKRMPQLVLESMGVTETEAAALRADKANLLFAINNLIAMSRKLTVPDVMSVLARHYWMSSNIYADANSTKCQFYSFNLTHVYKFDETGEKGGALRCVSMPTDHTVNGYYTFGSDLIEAIAGSLDGYTINGHLMRAYEGTKRFEVDDLSANEYLDIVYVPEVLQQIHNMQILGNKITNSNWDITQEPTTNAVLHSPVSEVKPADGQGMVNIPGPKSLVLLDSMSVTPTVEDTTIATRLTYAAVAAPAVTGNSVTTKVDCGTEAVWSSTLYLYDESVDKVQQYTLYSTYLARGSLTDNQYAGLMLMSNFDWAPLCIVFEPQQGGHYPAFFGGDITNPTTITPEALRNIHRACLLSEFGSFQ